MIPMRGKGRDSTIDPYYLSNMLRGTISSDDVTRLQNQIDKLNKTVYGAVGTKGLETAVTELQIIVNELREEGAKIQIKTTAEWEAIENTTSYLGLIYVYQDVESGALTQKVKIGNGVHTIANLPFISGVTVTEAEKNYWNNKVSIDIDELNENLIFII